jgi:hypothetical protein
VAAPGKIDQRSAVAPVTMLKEEADL